MKKKISVFAPILSVVLVGSCIGISLTGYSAPVYKVQAFEGNLTQNVDTNEQDKKNKEHSEADNEDMENSKAQSLNVNGCFDLEDGVYEGSGTGFSGIVRVAVEIKDKKIVNIEVISNEDDEAFFNRAKGVIANIIAGQSTDVDVISGATYSSRGIIEAVNNALKINGTSQGNGSNTNINSNNRENSNQSSNINEVLETLKDDEKLKDGIYYGTGTGFAGDLTVKVVIEGGKIISVSIVSTNDGDDFIAKASAILTDIVNKQNLDVDTVSGATYSSRGIIQAAANAIKQAVVTDSADVLNGYYGEENRSQNNVNSGGNSGKTSNNTDGNSIHKASDSVSEGNIPYIDGIYYGTGDGFSGEVKVSVEIKNHTIRAINVISTEDDAAFFDRAISLVDEMLEKQETKVDTVSGATFSSEGIIDAVNDALAAAKKATEEAERKDGSSQDAKDNESSQNINDKENTGDKEITDINQNTDDNENDKDISEDGKDDNKENQDDSKVQSNVYHDGTYLVNVICVPDEDEMFEEYHLSMNVTIESDKIVNITDVAGDGELSNNTYIKRASVGTSKLKGMIDKIIETGLNEEIDTVSGATCTSKSIIEGCKEAFEIAKIETDSDNSNENPEEDNHSNEDNNSISILYLSNQKANEEQNGGVEGLYIDLTEVDKQKRFNSLQLKDVNNLLSGGI